MHWKVKCYFKFCYTFSLSEASRYLVEVFSQVDEDEFQEWLDKIIEIVQKQPCKYSSCISISWVLPSDALSTSDVYFTIRLIDLLMIFFCLILNISQHNFPTTFYTCICFTINWNSLLLYFFLAWTCSEKQYLRNSKDNFQCSLLDHLIH